MASQIDLSEFVGKKFRVTLRNGRTYESRVKRAWEGRPPFYGLHLVLGSRYCQNGRIWTDDTVSYRDIIHIEEIQMPKYQKLEQKNSGTSSSANF